MKTKLLLAVACCFFLTSCVKDFQGSGGQDEVVLTEENFLYEGDLERIYLNEEIAVLENKIKDTSGDEQEALLKQRDELKQRISEIIDLGSIGIDIIGPCDLPNGKCVPVRLGYLVSSTKISEMLTVVSTLDGKKDLASAELSPLVEYGSEVQYTRLPVAEFGDQIIVKIAKKDINGQETFYSVTLGK